MARNFNGSTQYLNVSTDPAGSLPLTMFTWQKMTTAKTGTSQYLGDGTSNLDYLLLGAEGAADKARMGARNSGTAYYTDGTTTISGAWYATQANFRSATNRELYVSGTSEATDTTNSVTYPTVNRCSIGVLNRPSITWYYDGDLAHNAIWSSDLSTAKTTALSHGVPPLIIDNSNIVFYAPVDGNNSPENEYVSQNNLTLTASPTKSTTNPPVELLENYL